MNAKLFRSLVKRILQFTYRPFAIWYTQKDRWFKRSGLQIRVPSGVFHPGLFFSSILLADFISKQRLKGLNFLELGCGSAYISLVAAKHGANVSASDINPRAVAAATKNSKINLLPISVYESDLFSNIPAQLFDMIVINPPYYPRDPKNMAERAWFAGENLEYFKRLFKEIPTFVEPESKVYMCASEDVDLDSIQTLASNYKIQFKLMLKKKILFEENYVYQLIISF